MPEIDVIDSEYQVRPPAGKNFQIGYSGWGGKVQVVGGSYDVQKLGATADVLYGGDMSGDTAGLGIPLVSANGDRHFAHAVYADDNDAELGAGWVSAYFGSMKIYADVTPSVNLSAFGVTGQLHLDANIATIGNLCGVYGIVETSGAGVTITGNMFGAVFGATLAAGDTLAADYYAGGIIIGGNHAGTSTGKLVGVFLQNPSGDQFDAAFAFGQDSQMAGVVTAAAVGGSNTHKLKVYAGGTMYYIPMYTA